MLGNSGIGKVQMKSSVHIQKNCSILQKLLEIKAGRQTYHQIITKFSQG